MGQRETYLDTLVYALAIAGSQEELSKLLKVIPKKLEGWLNGTDDIPDWAFLCAVDVVIASSRESIARSRTLLAKAPKSFKVIP